jgi:GntR family transcriptional regulator, transcriptional repressor for pyruvate dehydrogenase complex
MLRNQTDAATGISGRVERAAAYELVVERIRRAIHLALYVPGDRLPSERALAEEMGVSRVTVREALRVLEGEGYVKSQRGAGGGPVVQQRKRETIEQLRASLRSRLQELEQTLEFREAVETAAAALAAERRTEDQLRDLAVLAEGLRTSGSQAIFRRADSAFHLLIGEASGNPLLRHAIEEARAAMFLPLDALNFEVMVETSVRGHRRIVAALEAADPRRAARTMADHIRTTRKELYIVLGVGEEEA